jgi:hypothetical protein
MKRRTFLKVVGGGATALGLGLTTRQARADTWGDVDPSVWPVGSTLATRVLEIYLWGGMAPWESFYYRPVPGGSTRGFDADVTALHWNGACAGTPGGLVTQALGNDANGNIVHLGPFAKPLWRTDIASRMRVVVMQHDLPPHEAAIPYALSGRPLGQADATGLGAPIQHRRRALDTSSAHPLPFSYCLLPTIAVGSAYFNTLDAVGNHGGNSKPIVLPIGSGTTSFLANLNRTTPDGTDALIAQYGAQYGAHLVPAGNSTAARSAAFADYESSASGLAAAPSLSTLLAAGPLAPVSGAVCSSETTAFATGSRLTRTALQAAAYLLNHPDLTKRANYACVVDGGLEGLGFSYDVHATGANPGQAQRTASNLWDTLDALASVLRAPGDPADPLKVDLNDTLVVIKTEFGRTPFRSLGGNPATAANGRDHWPDGYVNVLLGGPIQTAGVVGSISDGTGNTGQGVADAGHNYKPQDIQAAVLLAAGIDPFAVGNLQLGNLTASLQDTTHALSMIKLRQTILGVP